MIEPTQKKSSGWGSAAFSLFNLLKKLVCCRRYLRFSRLLRQLAIKLATTERRKEIKSIVFTSPLLPVSGGGNRGDYITKALKTLSKRVVHFYKSY